MPFTHLHVHSHYSLLDGLSRISDLVEHVKKHKMDSIALTDHGVLYGITEFQPLAQEMGVKPILGCEIYIAVGDRSSRDKVADKQRYHMTLLAKNQIGYKNLIKIVSDAHINGFYYKPRTDWKYLKEHSEGLIALTGCASGAVAHYAQLKKKDKALEMLKIIQNIFGQGNYYLEIQKFPEMEKTEPNHAVGREVMLDIAKQTKVPLVATNDAHYINPDDKEAHDLLLCLQTGKKVQDVDRMKMIGDFSVRTPERMEEIFSDCPEEALANTEKIAAQIEEYPIAYERIQPRYQKINEKETTQSILKEKAFAGAKKRYGNITKEIKERIDYELDIIHKKGYDDYFLVVFDYVTWARKQGILVGPGRGSGAGSVVAYSLTITGLDPFKYELYFERFLNPERPSPPDFDIDFQDDRRDELFHYMTKTYGFKNTSFIGTFGRMQTRAAIRDVARVLDIDLAIADKLSKLVEVKFGKVAHIEDMIKNNQEFSDIINSTNELKKLAEVVTKIEGLARHVSIHACGYLVTPDPITNYIPLQVESGEGNKIITQVEGHNLEGLGFMKFDFLGLANLTIIKNTLNLIKKFKNIEIDIDNIPLDDKKTIELFQRGETTAIFQFESEGMKKYLRELKPSEFEDLIFMNAAYRPGPMSCIPDYIKRKYGKQKITYLHPKLKPILEKTNGFPIYQEQILRIAVDMAGYTLGKADLLRKAMGKKKKEIMEVEKKKFIQGCLDQGHEQKLADKLFKYIEPFADYGFVRAHATAYAMIAFQTAYLKTYYPVEFLAGLMQTDLGDSDKITRDMVEANRMNIEIHPPDINKSDKGFTIDGQKTIRFGLAAIKNLGSNAIAEILRERKNGKFTSLANILERLNIREVNKKSMESLVKAGTLDKLVNRSQAWANIEMVLQYMKLKSEDRERGQDSLFGGANNSADAENNETTLKLAPVDKEDDKMNLVWERELLGIFLSDHPLNPYRGYLTKKTSQIADISLYDIDRKKIVGGIISNLRIINTKKGDQMAFVTLEDFTGKIDTVFFPKTWKKFQDQIAIDNIVALIGKVNHRNDELSLLVDECRPLSDKHKNYDIENKDEDTNQLETEEVKTYHECYFDIDSLSKDEMQDFKNYLNQNGTGQIVVKIRIRNQTIETPYKIGYNKNIESELKDKFNLKPQFVA